jgi:hypothetical protein
VGGDETIIVWDTLKMKPTQSINLREILTAQSISFTSPFTITTVKICALSNTLALYVESVPYILFFDIIDNDSTSSLQFSGSVELPCLPFDFEFDGEGHGWVALESKPSIAFIQYTPSENIKVYPVFQFLRFKQVYQPF